MSTHDNREEALLNCASQYRSAEGRKGFLDGACGDDDALRQRVEALLQAQTNAQTLKEEPLGQMPELEGVTIPVTEKTGDTIGRYKLLQKIGEGGFGVVYMAEQQEPVKRRVALKVIKLGMDTRSVVARFEAERQALALMDHPNIAKVLDGGATDSGRPYFVMELVKGERITEYCNHQKLSTPKRLELLIKVCQAVQHAHQKGIIHRDIKPTNILITEQEGKAVPKVIDFGIAKAVDRPLTEKTLVTAFEQFLGTPAYVSPEQAEMRGLDVDTRTDIYALGVLLYELLTGRTPFDARQLLESGIDEMRRKIREEEPPHPSTRLTTLDQAELAKVASFQRSDPDKLSGLLRGDLDWIVMKAIDKDRNRRYETANALGMDIHRHLNNEPVTAVAPSNLYRLQKMMRRNKGTFTAASAVVVALIAGLVVSVWQAHRANQELKRGRIEEGKAWLERAQSYLEERNPFHAKLMAGRAIGFEGFGREKLSRAQQEKMPELLPPESAEARAAERILLGEDDYAPIWHSPVATNKSGIVYSALSIAFSPDGKLLAQSSALGGSIELWNTATGEKKATLLGHSSYVYRMVFSPDGRLLASGSYDSTIRVWDVATGTVEYQLDWIRTRIGTLAFSPDGQSLAANATYVGPARVWELPSGRVLRTWGEASDKVSCLAFSPDGALLALGTDTKIQVFELATDQLKGQWEAHGRQILGLAWSSDGRYLASGSYDGTVNLWDPNAVPSGKLITQLSKHASSVHNIQFSPDGAILASVDLSGVVRLLEVPRGGLRAVLRTSAPSGVSAVDRQICFSPDRSLLAVGGKVLQLWELTSRHVQEDLTAHSAMVRRVAVRNNSNGIQLASGGDDDTMGLWDLASGQSKPEWSRKHPDDVLAVALSPDGQVVASGDRQGDIRLWDAATGRQLPPNLEGHGSNGKGDVRTLAFSPNGLLLASASFDHTVRLWDVTQRKLRDTNPVLQFSRAVNDLAFDPLGRLLATADAGSPNVKLWDVATGKEMVSALETVSTHKVISPFDSVSFSPDGQYLAAGSRHGDIIFWEIKTGKWIAALEGHSDHVRSLDFSPTGNLLASGGTDATIALWDVADVGSIKLLGTLMGHSAEVYSVAFTSTPGGLRLISGSQDTTIRVWDINAALKRAPDYAGFLNQFDLEGRKVTWKFLGTNENRFATASIPLQSFSGNSLVALLQSGVSGEDLDRKLFYRFLRAGNLQSAALILERNHAGNWKLEQKRLGKAYENNADAMLERGGDRLAKYFTGKSQYWRRMSSAGE